jgi:hypothetical protein
MAPDAASSHQPSAIGYQPTGAVCFSLFSFYFPLEGVVMQVNRLQAARWITLVLGIITLLTGLALLFAPSWFFFNIGHFEPFNRHYEGDLGVFQLGLGVGLIAAWRDVTRHRLMIGAAALGNALHVLNHAYDAILIHAPLSYWLSDSGPVAFAAVALVIAWLWAAPEASPQHV